MLGKIYEAVSGRNSGVAPHDVSLLSDDNSSRMSASSLTVYKPSPVAQLFSPSSESMQIQPQMQHLASRFSSTVDDMDIQTLGVVIAGRHLEIENFSQFYNGNSQCIGYCGDEFLRRVAMTGALDGTDIIGLSGRDFFSDFTAEEREIYS
jgi:hypothetical protein